MPSGLPASGVKRRPVSIHASLSSRVPWDRPVSFHRTKGIQVSAPPRVRFAPSPTGRLHIGGARTAIYNWAYA
ncbi:MAG: hypothetical protein KGZ40_06245, partial [Clostridiales bacterium]|nr:hypothetical protein [Clostridiales bacterium]